MAQIFQRNKKYSITESLEHEESSKMHLVFWQAGLEFFKNPLPTNDQTTDKIIRASCALHNWLRLTSPGHYFPRGCVDEEDIDSGSVSEGSWRRELKATLPTITDHSANNAARTARELRDKYAEFFSGAGAVSWQNRMIS